MPGGFETMLLNAEISYTLGHVTGEAVHLDRGIPQGAPESPLLFALVTEMVLRPVLKKLRKNGRGWVVDDFWLAAVAFADDILLVGLSLRDVRSTLEVNLKMLRGSALRLAR